MLNFLRDKTTPARSSNSSLSRDSLGTVTPDREGAPDVPPTPVKPADSFTIDFGDTDNKRKVITCIYFTKYGVNKFIVDWF